MKSLCSTRQKTCPSWRSNELYNNFIMSKSHSKVAVKKGVAGKQRKPVEERKEARQVKVEEKHKSYFRVSQDSLLLKAIHGKAFGSKHELASHFSEKLQKPLQSVIERVKKYLGKLSHQDQSKIHEEAKKNPNHIVIFNPKKAAEPRSIKCIKGPKPKILKKKVKKIAKVAKDSKKKKEKQVQEEDMKWLEQKLQNSDKYFQTENQIYLLTALLQNLHESNSITSEQRKLFLNSANKQMNLKQILTQLKINI